MDFEDCINGLNDIINGEDDALSFDERIAAERIYRMCEEYMEAFEDMNDLEL